MSLRPVPEMKPRKAPRADLREEGDDGAFLGEEEFAEESAEKGADNHTDGRNNHPHEKADDGAPTAVFAAAGDLGEPGGNHIVQDADKHHHGQPDEQESEGHRLPGTIGSVAPDVQQQHPHPADGRPRQARNHAAHNAHQRKDDGQNCNKCFHCTKIFIIFEQNKTSSVCLQKKFTFAVVRRSSKKCRITASTG